MINLEYKCRKLQEEVWNFDTINDFNDDRKGEINELLTDVYEFLEEIKPYIEGR